MPAPERRRRLQPADPPIPAPAADLAVRAADVTAPVEPRVSTTDEERETERGLRGLVGSGASQVSVSAALRARDAARSSEADLADAEHNLVIVRRGWTPREDLPRAR